MARRTIATVLYEPEGAGYKVTGRPGKVIPFRHPRGFYPKNIAQMYAQMYAAGGLGGIKGHTAVCARCGRQADIEDIAKRRTCGWEWIGGSGWRCYACACEMESGVRSWR